MSRKRPRRPFSLSFVWLPDFRQPPGPRVDTTAQGAGTTRRRPPYHAPAHAGSPPSPRSRSPVSHRGLGGDMITRVPNACCLSAGPAPGHENPGGESETHASAPILAALPAALRRPLQFLLASLFGDSDEHAGRCAGPATLHWSVTKSGPPRHR